MYDYKIPFVDKKKDFHWKSNQIWMLCENIMLFVLYYWQTF